MESKKTLNMIIQDHQNIEMKLLESEGILSEDLEELLEVNASELGDKLDGYEKFIRYLKGQVEYLKDMESHYSKKRKILENSINRYRISMVNAMEIMNKDKVKTSDFNYSIAESQKWDLHINSLNDELKAYLLKNNLAEEVFKPHINRIKAEYKNSDKIPDWIKITKSNYIKSL